MFCGKCGTTIEEGASFCFNCGAVLDENDRTVFAGPVKKTEKPHAVNVASEFNTPSGINVAQAYDIKTPAKTYNPSSNNKVKDFIQNVLKIDLSGPAENKPAPLMHYAMIWLIPAFYIIICIILAFYSITGNNYILDFSDWLYEESALFRIIDIFTGFLYLFAAKLFFDARMKYANYSSRGGKKLRNAIIYLFFVILIYNFYIEWIEQEAFYDSINIMSSSVNSIIGWLVLINIIVLITNAVYRRMKRDFYCN